jgi:hypothetical protein
MGNLDNKQPVIRDEIRVSRFEQVDALVKLLIEKGIIGKEEFMAKAAQERGAHQEHLQKTTDNRKRRWRQGSF